MENRDIRVVLIEDDPMVQEVNRQFVERVDGFVVVGVAGNGRDGLQLIRELEPELVILDIYMPSMDGRDLIEHIRQAKLPVDVIVITAAKDAETIQGMLRGGAVDYIVKPFKFERVEQSLKRYMEGRIRLLANETLSQSGIDRILSGTDFVGDEGAGLVERRESSAVTALQDELPKGLHAVTLRQVLGFLQSRPGTPLSAEEVADGVGIARVTARRYLEYMERTGRLSLDVRYGGVGRPINRYVLVPEKR